MVQAVPAVQIVQAVQTSNAKLEVSRKREVVGEPLWLFVGRVLGPPYSVADF